jgi:predicted transporter
MEFKTLIIGMFVSMAAFSVKTGLGWGYILSRGGMARRAAMSLALAAAYAALFALAGTFAARAGLATRGGEFAALWQNGVTLHWITAILILAWGTALLKSGASGKCGAHGGASRAWLALVIPCPVCASVVLASASCVALYFPDRAVMAMAALYVAFVALAGAVAAASRLASHGGRDGGREASLGAAMMMIAAYFIVSALVTPQFADIGRVYRIAAHARGESSAATQSGNPGSAIALGSTAAIFAVGFATSGYKTATAKKRARAKIIEIGGEAG